MFCNFYVCDVFICMSSFSCLLTHTYVDVYLRSFTLMVCVRARARV